MFRLLSGLIPSSSLGTFWSPLDSGLSPDDCDRLRPLSAVPRMPSRVKLGARCDLAAVGDLSARPPLAPASCGEGISMAKPSLLGSGYDCLPTAVSVTDSGESPVEDDMAGSGTRRRTAAVVGESGSLSLSLKKAILLRRAGGSTTHQMGGSRVRSTSRARASAADAIAGKRAGEDSRANDSETTSDNTTSSRGSHHRGSRGAERSEQWVGRRADEGEKNGGDLGLGLGEEV